MNKLLGANLNVKRHLSVATMQSNSIDDNTTNAGFQVSVKDEPIDIKEEVTSEPDKWLNIEIFPDQKIKNELTLKFEGDYSDQENNAEDLLSNTHIDQSKPDGSSFTIKDESLLSIDIKEEVTKEVDKLSGSSHKKSTKSRLRIKEDYRDQGKDVRKVHVEKTKADDSKTKFSCNDCSKMFDMKLFSHIRSSHSQVKEKQNSSTKKHTETNSLIEENKNHNQKNKLDCHVCDKHFYSKSKLICHIRTHTGEKPFACDVCDKQFNQKSNLVNHIRTHTGEKPFACNVCNKQFIIKSNLVVHMRTHTGEKPFACNVCHKQFNQKSNIFNHMRTHTGEKPYACNVCDKQYSRNSSLVRHNEISHR